MPWSNQSGGGGPWGGGGGGGGGKDGGRGPWGGGNGGGPHPPDLEDLLRKSQDRLKNVLPGGDGIGPRGIAFIVIGLLIAWGLTGWYRVQPDEVGVNLVFGKFQSITPPGLNYNWPYPIGSVEKPAVTRTNSFDVGVRGDALRNNDESLMLTGDENIVDINFSVQWQIDPAKPQNYLFNMEDPDGTVRAVAESAMREAIGRRNIQPILTGERQAIEQQVLDLMQKALDEYQAGVIVRLVQLQKVDPPQQVIDAFRDVQAARADLERLQNEAQTYANRVVPEARGEVAQITQNAEAYRDRTVAEATGQAAAFVKVYDEYKKAPDVTRRRIYLETLSEVLSGADKIIIDDKGSGQGVVPYLPLNELLRQGGANQGGGQ
ncbi:FtsH protease activity modulator HflK [Labrys wisconsinensis]|uniref:Protein HflK n=1 Tax=Labrys wisconsinensis TaxID=425677 RepID=A0ABU0JB20_9HYPH|nr:FtsH protease activity modulator HflK [Labrys wisconsinensis]MDQ0471470.1 membrane protease subunit HflK [Labrys wisconsinensis]